MLNTKYFAYIYALYIYKHKLILPKKNTNPIIAGDLHKLLHFYPHSNLMNRKGLLLPFYI